MKDKFTIILDRARLLIKSYTKTFAVPGIRIGALFSNKQVVSNKIIYNLLAFLFFYMILFVGGSIIMTLLGIDFSLS